LCFVLVDDRGALAVVSHPGHQIPEAGAASCGDVVPGVPEIMKVQAFGADRPDGVWPCQWPGCENLGLDYGSLRLPRPGRPQRRPPASSAPPRRRAPAVAGHSRHTRKDGPSPLLPRLSTALRCRNKPFLDQGGACDAAGPASAPGARRATRRRGHADQDGSHGMQAGAANSHRSRLPIVPLAATASRAPTALLTRSAIAAALTRKPLTRELAPARTTERTRTWPRSWRVHEVEERPISITRRWITAGVRPGRDGHFDPSPGGRERGTVRR
jgi:hypothetical protein